MSRIDEIKKEVANRLSYKDWKELLELNDKNVNYVSEQLQKVNDIYLYECIKASLEKADKTFKNTAVKSIDTALQYFEGRSNETIHKRDVIKFLHAFYQFEAQGLSIIGMGYKRYDGKEITDLQGAYEGGFYTEKKKYQIINEDNIVLL